MKRIQSLLAALAGFVLLATDSGAQGMSPNGHDETIRFERVTHAVEKAGYKSPIIVGHGEGATDWLFVLLATQRDSGVLVATADPGSMTAAKPIVLERDRDPAQLGIRGVHIDTFLGAAGLFDVEVQHEPFQLEMSRRFDTHHVVRREGAGVANACEFSGGMSSSASKGIGSVGSVRRVTVEKVSGAATLTFDVKIVDETSERRNRDTAATVTAHSETRTRYELPVAGSCKVIR